jgi:hypothetical protein
MDLSDILIMKGRHGVPRLRFCDSPVFYPSRRDKISKLGVTRGNLRTEPKLKAVGRVDGLTYRERTQRSEDSPIVFFFAERIGR